MVLHRRGPLPTITLLAVCAALWTVAEGAMSTAAIARYLDQGGAPRGE